MKTTHENEMNPQLTKTDTAFALLAFHAFALPGRIVSAWHRIKFWLTVHVDCSWCKRRTHRAPLAFVNRSPAGKISHGMCERCYKNFTRTLR